MLQESLIEKGAKIGKDVFLGQDVHIDPGFERFLELEDNVILSQGVTILLHDSSLNNILGLPIKIGKVKICRNSYIGANATILCGIEIGENVLIGACSLVTKNIPSNTVAYGVPAKKICSISEIQNKYIEDMNKKYFFYWDTIPWRDRNKKFSSIEEQNLFFDFIYSIRHDLFNDAPNCLDFNNSASSHYLLFGWYGQENWPPTIRWTGKKAFAYLKADKTSRVLFVNAISNIPFINVNILINRRFAKKFAFNDAEMKVIDVKLSNQDTNIIEVIFEIDKTWIPDEVMKNGDKRELGIAVNKIWIE